MQRAAECHLDVVCIRPLESKDLYCLLRPCECLSLKEAGEVMM